jgi:outer membrane protein assembly factor BamA
MMGKKTRIVWTLMTLLSVRSLTGLPQAKAEERGKSWSVFPILMYDTDIGVGYGGKGKIVNFMGHRESFDLFLFNSSKGERTYVFTFAMPDFEIRQRTTYGLSLDVKAEYSKYLKQYFFGVGPDSHEDDLTYYTDEKKELLLTLGRGFSPSFVVELQYAAKNVRFFNVEQDRPHTDRLAAVGEVFSPCAALEVRFDTSDSQIHPLEGVRAILRGEAADGWLGNRHASYFRYSLDLRKYVRLLGARDVLAVRALIQKIGGNEIPLFELPVLGGGSEFNALRGYRLNRFRDRGKILCNLEYRFPLWKKIGGNFFLDAGTVWPQWSQIRWAGSATNAGWGLRYYLENFVARFDMGLGSEGLGIYFNFGHVF